jgi:AcrR family transcriptional regulator
MARAPRPVSTEDEQPAETAAPARRVPEVQRQPAEILGPRAQETILRIIEATRTVFLDHGYAGTTIDEIARVADVSRGSVYTYFASKRELLLAVGEKAADDNNSLLDKLPQLGTTRVGLRQWVNEYFEMLEIYGAFAFAWTQAAAADERIATQGRRRHKRLAKRFGTMLAATGGRTAADPTALGIVGFAMMERAWAYCRLYSGELDIESVKTETTALLWGAARAESRANAIAATANSPKAK